jgi:hypothetical protein
MKRNISFLIAIASVTFVAQAFSADWKYYGGSATHDNEKVVLFYDSGSIKKSKMNIRVWTKSISVDVINNLSEEQIKAIHEKATLKLKNGYVTPYSKVVPNADDDDITTAGLEQLASASTEVKSKVLTEINCSESKMKIHSMTTFNNGAVENTLDKPTTWSFIVPESNLEVLEKILCRKK